jgi:hypothetical protein
VDTTHDSTYTCLAKLDIGEGAVPMKDEIIVEVEVDNVKEEGIEKEEKLSNNDLEYNVTVEY